jgi:hypothetical protein
MKDDVITWAVREPLSDAELQELFSAVYKRPNTVPFHTILANCATWVSARKGGRLAGFANVIWDGLYHALIVDRCARVDETGALHHQVAVKVLEVLKRDYPTVTKIHIECDEKEIPLLEPFGFQRRTYGRILY